MRKGTFWVRLPGSAGHYFPDGTVVEMVDFTEHKDHEFMGQSFLKRFNNPVHEENGGVGQIMDYPWAPRLWLEISEEEIQIYIIAGG
jgi:hypothetical protein